MTLLTLGKPSSVVHQNKSQAVSSRLAIPVVNSWFTGTLSMCCQWCVSPATLVSFVDIPCCNAMCFIDCGHHYIVLRVILLMWQLITCVCLGSAEYSPIHVSSYSLSVTVTDFLKCYGFTGVGDVPCSYVCFEQGFFLLWDMTHINFVKQDNRSSVQNMSEQQLLGIF